MTDKMSLDIDSSDAVWQRLRAMPLDTVKEIISEARSGLVFPSRTELIERARHELLRRYLGECCRVELHVRRGQPK
jgi:hypothetical protein